MKPLLIALSVFAGYFLMVWGIGKVISFGLGDKDPELWGDQQRADRERVLAALQADFRAKQGHRSIRGDKS